MPLNAKQEELIGNTFSLTPKIKTPFLDLVKRTPAYYSNSTTIKFDEVIEQFKPAPVIARGTKIPTSEIGGFTRKTIEPDIIADKATISATETRNIRDGQTILVNGKAVSNYQYLVDRKLSLIKGNILTTMERIAANLFLTGAVTLPTSGTPFSYGLAAADATKSYSSANSFIKLIFEAVNAYEEDNNGRSPENTFVGKALFAKLIDDAKFQEAIRSFGGSIININTNGSVSYEGIVINIFGTKVRIMPLAKQMDGSAITSLDNYLHLSCSDAFVPAYAAIEYSNGNVVDLYQGEMFSDELPIDPEIAIKGFFTKSAFFPILTGIERIKRYIVTVS